MHVKVVFGNEIRRVNVGSKASLPQSFETLKIICTGIFENYNLPKRIALKYKDDEGDLVTISSDRELKEALSLVSENGILKLVIVEEPKKTKEFSSIFDEIVNKFIHTEPPKTGLENFFQQKEENEKKEEVKPEVTVSRTKTREIPIHLAICDNCQDQIQGIRYKCGVCADFDLCEECEKIEDLHCDHHFFKITKPLDNSLNQMENPKKSQKIQAEERAKTTRT